MNIEIGSMIVQCLEYTGTGRFFATQERFFHKAFYLLILLTLQTDFIIHYSLFLVRYSKNQ
jgi:hypothetical protein